MNNLEDKLLRIGVCIAPGGYITPNYDFPRHIRNSIYSFLCQCYNTSSFVDYFIREKKLYFKENKAILKRFFNGLLYYVERLDDEYKKDFYSYLLNNDISKQAVKDAYNAIHRLKHDDKLTIELKKFYKVSNLLPILAQHVRLNELENQELLEKVGHNTVYKQYLPISFVELAILEIFIYRQKRYSDVVVKKVNWRAAKKSVYYTNKNESVLDTKDKFNLFEANAGKLYKKGFSCFRFDFMPTKKADPPAIKKHEKSKPFRAVNTTPSKSPRVSPNRKNKLHEAETISAFRTHRQILQNLK